MKPWAAIAIIFCAGMIVMWCIDHLSVGVR